MINNILEYLETTSKAFPDKIAFSDSERDITFGQLKKEAMKMAMHIQKEVMHAPIAIYLEKGVTEIVAFLGVVYSGNYYSPIDIQMPLERLQAIIRKLQPKYIITDSRRLGALKGISTEVILIDNYQDIEIDESRLQENKNKLIDTDILYVLFTSGSTGSPKGVLINHRAVIDYTEWVTETLRINEECVFGNQAPFYFDNSVLDIYQCLKNGAEMQIIPENLFSRPRRLLQHMVEKKINTIFWVPSALCIVANSGELDNIHVNRLLNVFFAGEVMPVRQLNLWRSHYPEALFVNLYGPTEITVDCTYYVVDRQYDEDEQIPIGVSCKNSGVFLLDENDEEIRSTVPEIEGEICVRGSGLSSGYLNDEYKTNEAFVQNPLNNHYKEMIYRTGDLAKYNIRGELIFVGRKDLQVKISGYRIELGEIETAVSSVDGVDAVCCLFDSEKKQIICVYSGCSEKKEIRDRIKKMIPRYMMPHRYISIDSMPLNSNMKIDRVELSKRLIN